MPAAMERILGCVLHVSTLAALAWAVPAFAAEPREIERQTREFRVSVDGTPRGKCTMQISRRDDKTERVEVEASIRVNFVVYRYTYSASGSEVWKDGRLVELENTANYNGDRYVVKATPAGKSLKVTVNGKAAQTAPDAWATSYWRLPEHLGDDPDKVVHAAGKAARKGEPQAVPLLDSDHGRALRGELARIGDEAVTIGGKRLRCTHYRLTGDVQVELWYDAERRLVRQESVDAGHKTVLELVRLTDE